MPELIIKPPLKLLLLLRLIIEALLVAPIVSAPEPEIIPLSDND